MLLGIVTGEFVGGILIEGLAGEGGTLLLYMLLGIVTGEFVDGIVLLFEMVTPEIDGIVISW